MDSAKDRPAISGALRVQLERGHVGSQGSFSLGLECPAPLPGWVPYALRGWPTRHRMQSAARVLQSHIRPILGSQEVLPKRGEHRGELNYYREAHSTTGRSRALPVAETLLMSQSG